MIIFQPILPVGRKVLQRSNPNQTISHKSDVNLPFSLILEKFLQFLFQLTCTHPPQFNPYQSISIQINPNQSNPIQSNSIQLNPIQSNSIQPPSHPLAPSPPLLPLITRFSPLSDFSLFSLPHSASLRSIPSRCAQYPIPDPSAERNEKKGPAQLVIIGTISVP